MTLDTDSSHDQYSLRTPAHRFHQGGRDVYSFALDLAILDNLLPDRVDDRVVKDANRPLTTSHAKKIQDYLENRDDWLLGTLLLGIPPDEVEFSPYQEERDEEAVIVGELRIRTSGVNMMKMFDGQHRRRAIKNALTELRRYARRSGTPSSLWEASVPIMLYAEGSIEALRQMFADASRTKTIERNTVTQFDRRDAFNLAALWLEESSALFAGRVELERTSVPRTSHCIIAINQLAATLKTLDVGYKGRVSNDRNDGYMLDLDMLTERCLTWADDFMPSARQEYDDLLSGEIDNSELPEKRAITFAYNTVVIRILAGCYYEWVKDGTHWKPLADFLRSASLGPGSGEGALLVDSGSVVPGGIYPIARQDNMVRAIDYIVRQAKATNY